MDWLWNTKFIQRLDKLDILLKDMQRCKNIIALTGGRAGVYTYNELVEEYNQKKFWCMRKKDKIVVDHV